MRQPTWERVAANTRQPSGKGQALTTFLENSGTTGRPSWKTLAPPAVDRILCDLTNSSAPHQVATVGTVACGG
jgi:hypothetical protein